MRLYDGTLDDFREDVLNNRIADELEQRFEAYYRGRPSSSEYRSWENSLRALKDAFEYDGLRELRDNRIILEYRIPTTDRRIDALVFGKGKGFQGLVLVELKQWSNEGVRDSDEEGNVRALIDYRWTTVPHPSLQVEGYYYGLKDNLTVFEQDPSVQIAPAVYCHNYSRERDRVLYQKKFEKALERYPLFSKEDYEALGEYLKKRILGGPASDVYERFVGSLIKPSKQLMSYVREMVNNQQVFYLIDEQIAARNAIVSRAKRMANGKKSVIIVKGGPGTGKSVIALETMAELLSEGKDVYYATGSNAFTNTLRKLVGVRARGRIKYFFNFTDRADDEVDAIICDEAHRLRANSNDYRVPRELRSDRPQVEDIIRPAKLSVFFIDEKQVVRPNEVGSVQLIREAAKKFGAEIEEFELRTQFRCGGSESYMEWLDGILGISGEAKVLSKNEPMGFEIVGSPEELREKIRERNEEKPNSARLVAGFCWPWSEPRDDGSLVDDVVIGSFRMPWEKKDEFWKWATDPSGMDQVGTVYTAQGFEFDYVGVIFGNDLVYDWEKKRWVGKPENSYDVMAKRGGEEQFTKYLQDTYRVLLSRAHLGVYVYFMDKGTEKYFRSKTDK